MILKTDGAAQQVGLRPGDIIRQVNGRAIRTTGDLAGALNAPARMWQLVVERGGQQIAVTLEA
jgi:S1-C subfamily serine protease